LAPRAGAAIFCPERQPGNRDAHAGADPAAFEQREQIVARLRQIVPGEGVIADHDELALTSGMACPRIARCR
jgi:hypothetical protein